MKKKDRSELHEVYDQALSQIGKIIELPAETPAEMLQKSKSVASELLQQTIQLMNLY
ncbi:hypothetical protein V8B55DRAFT_1489389 [Mucor lusitanicus]